MQHTHAFEWSEMLQMYVCGCGVTHWSRLERTQESHHLVSIFRGNEHLIDDLIPYSTLNEAKDHADWLRGEQGKDTDICFIFEVDIDEQGSTCTEHHPRYRATI